MSRLELEYEIQCKIISAAVRLSKEKGIEKSIKKERLQAAQRAQVNEHNACDALKTQRGPRLASPAVEPGAPGAVF